MERKEDSVLHSLKELRRIEENRIRAEQEVERQRIEEEKRLEEEAKRKAKEEEERRVREERERLEREKQQRERQEREDKLHLEAAERKARIDAQAKIEAARVQAEVSAKAQAKKPHVGLIVGSVGGVILLAAAALFYVLGVYIPQRDAELAKKHQFEQEKAIAAAVQKARAELNAEYQIRIQNAKSQAEREALQRELEAKQREREVQVRSSSRAKVAPPATPQKKQGLILKCDPEKDPLCGADIK